MVTWFVDPNLGPKSVKIPAKARYYRREWQVSGKAMAAGASIAAGFIEHEHRFAEHENENENGHEHENENGLMR